MKRLILLFIIFVGCIPPTFAKWATPEDAPLSIDLYDKKIKINKDGTYHEHVHIRMTALNQGGREALTSYSLTYNGSSETLRILKAETHLEGKTHPVSKENIEDKSVASSSSGFDDIRNVMISFPKAEVGASVELIYEHTVKEPILPQFYSQVLFFGIEGVWQKSTVEVNSELPIYIELNDPQGAISTSFEDKSLPHKNFTLTLKKENFITAPIQEPTDTVLDWKKLTWFVLSTEKIWKAYARKMAKGYEKVRAQKIPESLETLVTLAKKISSPYDQINFITSTLASNFQYMGDWRSVKNQFFPRDLETIVKTQTGDCKDFSAVTAALLSHLGYKAEFALVERGLGSRAVPTHYVTAQSFNHVFLKVTTPEGKTLWIDPTNFTSMSRHIFPDVADKPVLILSTEHPNFERSPALTPEENRITTYQEVDFSGTDPIFSAHVKLEGVTPNTLTGLALYQSKTTLEDTLVSLFLGTSLSKKEKMSIEIPDLSSRVVEDLVIKLRYQKEHALLQSNLGRAISVKELFPPVLVEKTDTLVKDIFLGTPQIKTKHTRLLNTHIKNASAFDCTLDTPWLSLKRHVSYTNGHTDIIDTYTSKVSFIPTRDFASDAYKAMQAVLWKNFVNAIYVLPKSKENT